MEFALTHMLLSIEHTGWSQRLTRQYTRAGWVEGRLLPYLVSTPLKNKILSYQQREEQQMLLPKTHMQTHCIQKKKKRPFTPGEGAGNSPGPRPLGISCCRPMCWPETNAKKSSLHCIHCLYIKRIQKYSVSDEFPFPTSVHWGIVEGGCAFFSSVEIFILPVIH